MSLDITMCVLQLCQDLGPERHFPHVQCQDLDTLSFIKDWCMRREEHSGVIQTRWDWSRFLFHQHGGDMALCYCCCACFNLWFSSQRLRHFFFPMFICLQLNELALGHAHRVIFNMFKGAWPEVPTMWITNTTVTTAIKRGFGNSVIRC